ncbi:MAG: TrkA family potassium uptake protein [Clostridia bacterium]|nr:TrkA family potassium uptake protein [Clostridia bacterium]
MKSVLLIGLGRFGKHVAIKLSELNHQVMAIDKLEDRVSDVLPYVTNAQIGDSTNEEFLKSIGINDYDICMVTIENDFQSSLETTALLKELGAKKVISRAGRDVHAKFLLRNGADEVVYPEKQVAYWSAIRYTSDHIFGYTEINDEYAIYEVAVPSRWIGSTIGQIDIRKKYRINILGKKKNEELSLSVHPDTLLEEDETLLVVGKYSDIQKCFHL